MKNVTIKVFYISLAMLLTQCFTETVERVSVVPFKEIEDKLKELRDLEKQLNDETVESVDLQAKIDDLIAEINSFIPPGNVPLTYSLGILSTNPQAQQLGVSDAVVTIHIRDEVFTATSKASGQVVFEDLRSGVALVNISHPGYTDVSFVVNLLVDATKTKDLLSGDSYNVTSTIGIYPTTVSLGASTHSGTLFFDPDRTNDILQPTDPNYGRINYFDNSVIANSGNVALRPYAPSPRLTLTNGAENATPTIFPILDARVQSWVPVTQLVEIFVGVQPDPFYYGFVPPGTEGNIIIAVYEEMFTRTTSTTSGTYSVVVPDANRGVTVNYRLSEFEGTETYFRAENLVTAPPPSVTNFTSRTRNVVFTAMYRLIYGFSFETPGSPFDPTQVNNFTVVWNTYLSNVAPLDFYFGARAKNE